jgi:thiol-disulfide isomerase/thioredoxin
MFSLLLVFVSFAVACKKSDDAGETTPPVGVYVGNVATGFSEVDANDLTITLESLRGKVILLEFSTMWCGPCRAEAAELMGLYNAYRERGFVIVQCIYQDEDHNPADRADLLRWMQEFAISFTVFNDPDKSTVNAYKLTAIPLNIVIGRDFVIRYRQEGYYPAAVKQAIEGLL